MIPTPVVKVKYLTNKDLLEQIHVSKKSYCSFLEPAYGDYDVITQDLATVTPEVLLQARQKRAEILSLRAKKASQALGEKIPPAKIDPESIDIESVVVRLMTYDHIPPHPVKALTGKTNAERHVKVNFPAFQHYVFREGTWMCVGKSHWRGGLQNGEFCVTHGKMTNKLAMMFMKLVEKYGRKGNWRGYCVDTNTQALTQRGWLNIDEINESDIILSYDNGQMKWSKIKSIYRGHYNGLMHLLTSSGMSALVTPGHKFVTQRGLIPVENLLADDILILMGNERADSTPLADNSLNDEDMLWARRACLGDVGEDKSIKVQDINFHSGWSNSQPIPTVPYVGQVWCPETEYGSFVARRNGKVYLTGNTYNDEMQCQALLQLSQIGLQFDESRSENPFAYYTAAVTNSFTRILNTEKRNQTIRDDLLIMHGALPSYTRQTDNDIAQKAANEQQVAGDQPA